MFYSYSVLYSTFLIFLMSSNLLFPSLFFSEENNDSPLFSPLILQCLISFYPGFYKRESFTNNSPTPDNCISILFALALFPVFRILRYPLSKKKKILSYIKNIFFYSTLKSIISNELKVKSAHMVSISLTI